MAFSFFKGSRKQVEKTPAALDEAQEKVEEIALDKIVPNQNQPRKIFTQEAINELAATITEHGLLQPIVVRPYGNDQYEIIAGERRFRAVSQLKWEKVPAIVKKMSDQQSASLAVIENLQREGLTPIEEAQAYKDLMEFNQLTQKELAQEIGKSQSFVANKLRLLKLSQPVKQALLNKNITERHGRAMSGLEAGQQVYVLNEIAEKKLSVKETEALVKKLKQGPKKAAKRQIKGVVKDFRIAANTVKDALKLIEKTGFEVTLKEEQTKDGYRMIVEFQSKK